MRKDALRNASIDYQLDGQARLTTSQLATRLGLRTGELMAHLIRLGVLEVRDGHKEITPRGQALGGVCRHSARYGDYFIWPDNIHLTCQAGR